MATTSDTASLNSFNDQILNRLTERHNSSLSVILTGSETEQEVKDIADKRSYFLKYSKHCKLPTYLDKREVVKDANKLFDEEYSCDSSIKSKDSLPENDEPSDRVFATQEQAQKTYTLKQVESLKNKPKIRRVSFSDSNIEMKETVKEPLKKDIIVDAASLLRSSSTMKTDQPTLKIDTIKKDLDTAILLQSTFQKDEQKIAMEQIKQIVSTGIQMKKQIEVPSKKSWELTKRSRKPSLLATSKPYIPDQEDESNDSLATKRSSHGSIESKAIKEESVLQRVIGLFRKVSMKEKTSTTSL